VRCFFGADGGARVWLNHRPVYGHWSDDQPCRGAVNWFDIELSEGLNPVLVKVENGRGPWEFTLEAYDRADSLRALLRQVDTLLLATDSIGGHPAADDSLRVTMTCDLPLPSGAYRGGVAVLSGGGDTLARVGAFNGNACTLPVGAAAGALRLIGWIERPDGPPLQTERWMYRGDLAAALEAIAARFAALPAPERLSGQKRKPGRLSLLIYRRCGDWLGQWLTVVRSARDDAAIRQLTYASQALAFLEAVGQGRPPREGGFIPLLFTFKNLPGDTSGYDPSSWLSYKYPRTFRPPARQGGTRGYAAWLYLPPQWTGHSRLPLLCALHDELGAGEELDRIRHFGPAAYVEAGNPLKMAVLLPQCPAGTWWDAVLINAITAEVVQTGGVDKDRVAIAGAGMGGSAVWHLCGLYGQGWAAAVAVSGAGDADQACTMPQLPLRVYHGGQDTVVGVSQAAGMVEKLRGCGWRGIDFSVFAEAGHQIWPVVFGSPELYVWLLRQRR
jgi:pimeloyl-ACP methyl ester carboxylesterase